MLTSHQTMLLATAGVLLRWASDALSAFEADLVAEVCARFTVFKADTVVTALEWPVIEDAVAAMRAVLRVQVLAPIANAFAD